MTTDCPCMWYSKTINIHRIQKNKFKSDQIKKPRKNKKTLIFCWKKYETYSVFDNDFDRSISKTIKFWKNLLKRHMLKMCEAFYFWNKSNNKENLVGFIIFPIETLLSQKFWHTWPVRSDWPGNWLIIFC